MSDPSPTIHEAVSYGIKIISRPTKAVLISGLVFAIILPLLGFSLLCLLLLPISILLSILYSSRAAAKWKLWAYKNVSDIHQLQRSAELAGVLMKHSYNKLGFVVNQWEKIELRKLQEKFDEDVAYTDDPDIPEKENIYSRSSRDITFIINNTGIYVTETDTLCEWDKISDERIATLTYNRATAGMGGTVKGGSDEVFRFEYGTTRYEFYMRTLAIPTWKLDLLIYTYQNRYIAEQHNKATP